MKQFLVQFIVLLLLIQTFNLSVNSVEFYTPIKQSALKSDDMDFIDSMVEYLFENIMGYSKNTFHDKANTHNTSKQQNNFHFNLKWLSNPVLFLNLSEPSKNIVLLIIKNEELTNLYFKEVPVKPPQLLSA